MSTKGRPQSPWWTHFEKVDGMFPNYLIFFQFSPNSRRLSPGAMSSLQPAGEKRQTRLQHQGGVQLWNGKPHEDKALGRSCSGGDFNLSLGIAQNFTPFRFSAGFILPRRVLWCKIRKMRLFVDLCPCSS